MDITVPINRKRLPLLFVISSSLMILLGGSLFYVRPDVKIFISMILFIPLAYMLISFAQFLKVRFDKKAGLVVSDIGIYDNLSIFSVGLIQWEDITTVEIAKSFGTNLLVVKLRDNHKYLRKNNIFKRY